MVMASATALIAQLDEEKAASNTPATGTAWNLYTPSATVGTPYPTTRTPTEYDLYNQSYWHQRDYNRMHQNQRAENARQDWNRFMYGRP